MGAGRLPDPASLTARFREIEGFEGCAIVHRDGDMLATSWTGKGSDMLEVMAPQIVKRVRQYMEHVSVEPPLSVTVAVSGRWFTFVQGGDICFVAVHAEEGCTRRHVEIAQQVGRSVGERLSGASGF